MSGEIVYVFKKVEDSSITPDLWRKDGRYEFSGLGYEDDAMVVNDCLYRDILEKEMTRL